MVMQINRRSDGVGGENVLKKDKYPLMYRYPKLPLYLSGVSVSVSAIALTISILLLLLR